MGRQWRILERVNIELVSGSKKCDKLIAKPNFKHRKIFDENLAAIHMNRTMILFNKPIYVGMCILEISKILIYYFHYNIMKPKHGDKIELCYQDTDSYIYNIKTIDFYEEMKERLTILIQVIIL